MEALIKQAQNQLKQKEEHLASLKNQTAACEKEIDELQRFLKTAQAQMTQASSSAETTNNKNKHTMASSSTSPKEEAKSWADIAEEEEEEKEKEKQDEQKVKKWYVIFNGPFKGIYSNWAIANSHIAGKNVTHQSYKTKQEAEQAFREAYKTIATEEVQKSSTSTKTPLGTPIKINTKSMLDRIMTTKEKEELKKPTSEKFARLWDNLVHYKEIYTTMGFYPRNRRPGPKAVLVPGVEPLTAWEYFTHGFIDTIYIDGKTLREIRDFPPKLQLAIKNYKERFAKDRNLFIQLYSSYPVFDEAMRMIVPSISLGYLGVSNGEYPTIDELPEETPQPSHLIKALSGVYLGTSRIGTGEGQRRNIRINYYSRTLLIYSADKAIINEAGMQAIRNFEEPFEEFTDYLEILPDEFKRSLCQLILGAPGHHCKYCAENQEEDVH